VLTPEELPHYTIDDYLQWEGRWELIEGIPYAMTPSPGVRHQRISQIIAYQLERSLEGCPDCRALLPTDWRVTEDTVLQPDNMVICYRPVQPFLTKAPSLIFEVLSAASAEKDRRTKYAIYEREGVTYYVIVDPENEVAKVFRLHDGRYIKELDATEESYPFVLGTCRIVFDFSRIWRE